MALRTWIGASFTTPQVDTITVGSHTSGQTFSYTVNGKTFTYTAQSTDTSVLLVATNFLAVLDAVTETEFTELTFALGTTSGTITVTGAASGAPFTGTVGGTGTISTTTTTTAASPNDYSLAANWSGATLPTTGDTVVFASGSVSALWNLGALSSVVLASWTRQAGYTGVIGLPDTNVSGYVEYRATHVAVNCAAIRVEQPTSDQVGQVRVNCTLTGSAVTLTVAGSGGGVASAGQGYSADVYGMPSGQTNVVNATGAALAIAQTSNQTATVATLRAASSTIFLGSGVTLTNPTVLGGTAQINCSFTSLVIDQNAAVTVGQAAAASTGSTLKSGTLSWQSTGGLGAVTIAGGAALDLSQCPAAVTVGTITRLAGSTLNDPLSCLTRSYTEVYSDCDQSDCTTTRGRGFTAVIS